MLLTYPELNNSMDPIGSVQLIVTAVNKIRGLINLVGENESECEELMRKCLMVQNTLMRLQKFQRPELREVITHLVNLIVGVSSEKSEGILPYLEHLAKKKKGFKKIVAFLKGEDVAGKLKQLNLKLDQALTVLNNALLTPEDPLELVFQEVQHDRNKVLGSGANKVVYEGHWNSKRVAVLEYKRFGIDQYNLEILRKLQNVQHEFITYCHGYVIGSNLSGFAIIHEYAELGALSLFLKHQVNPISFYLKISALNQVCKGLMELHKNGFIHRDIAARNILVMQASVDSITVKISDFDSMWVATGEYQQTSCGTGKRIGQERHFPLRWMHSDSVIDGVWNQETDIYSFGVLIWEVYHNAELPWKLLNSNELEQAIRSNSRPDLEFVEAPYNIQYLYGRCCSGDKAEVLLSWLRVEDRFKEIVVDQSAVVQPFENLTNVGQQIRYAARHGGCRQLKELVDVWKNTIAINAGNCYGMTALHFAAYRGNLKKCVILVDGGANPNSRSIKPWTSFMSFRKIQVGSSPLHCAAIGGHVNCYRYLVQNGAIELQDTDGKCPMSFINLNGSIFRRMYRGVFGLSERDLEEQSNWHSAMRESYNRSSGSFHHSAGGSSFDRIVLQPFSNLNED